MAYAAGGVVSYMIDPESLYASPMILAGAFATSGMAMWACGRFMSRKPRERGQ